MDERPIRKFNRFSSKLYYHILFDQKHKDIFSNAFYSALSQEDYKKNILGTKTSVTDDVTYAAYSDAQSKITGIGYKQKTVSTGSSRPTSMISVCLFDEYLIHFQLNVSFNHLHHLRMLEIYPSSVFSGRSPNV